MGEHLLTMDRTFLNRLFPFYVLFGEDMLIVSVGDSMFKLNQVKSGDSFTSLFTVKRPHMDAVDTHQLKQLSNQLIILQANESANSELFIRGQIDYVAEASLFLFTGTPWFNNVDHLLMHGLTIRDFAMHDATIDLLHVLKTQEIASEDLKLVVETVNRQQEELKRANREIEDIALFPMQNPDPLIRISLDGQLLSYNPAAALIQHVNYRGATMGITDFCQEIAKGSSIHRSKWMIEAIVDERLFSFNCVLLHEYGYINVYGRDITLAKKYQEENEELSLAARASLNPVLFYDENDRISWCNTSTEEVFGYSMQEMQGNTVDIFWGPDTLRENKAKVKQHIRHRQHFVIENILYRKDGTSFIAKVESQFIRTSYGKSIRIVVVEDVTAEKLKEEKLKTLSLIAEETINAAILTDEKGKIVWVNHAFEEITEYTLHEVKGKHPGHLLQGTNTDPKTIAYLRMQIKNAAPFTCEILNYSKSNRPYWVKINGKPLFDEFGKLSSFFALEEDITESKLAREELAQTASRLSALLTNLKTGMLLENEFRQIVLTNKEFCSIFNIPISPDDLIGADCSDSAETSKHLFKEPDIFVKRIDELLKRREVCLNDILEMKDGRVLQRDFIPIITNGRYMGHLWKYDDITQRHQGAIRIKLQEEKYRNIISNMNLGLMEVDNEDRIIYINQSFTAISGYLPEELIGNKASTIFLDQGTSPILAEKSSIRKSGIADMYTLPVKNKDGHQRWWVISGAPNYNDDGELIGSIGVHLDVTEQKIMEEELRIAKQKAEESSMAKEYFLATMSHEIRTPLNAIVGISDLMLIDTNARNKENIDILNFSSRNLLSLITDILDLTKIDAGKVEIAKNPIDLNEILQSVSQSFRLACEEKNIEFQLDIQQGTPFNILGDELRLWQILNNLLGNAVKFTSKGSIRLEVKSSKRSGKQVRYYFRLTDTGIGIRKEHKELIFQAFEQAEHQIGKQFGGTGLGLNITRKLIRMHGGEISVESKYNKGSVFSFYIDYDLWKTSKISKKNIAGSKRLHSKALTGMHILVVEDNPVNQMVVVSYLKHWKLKSDIANNGKEAMDLLTKHQYDLILMDLYMPIMDGFETIRRLRKSKKWKQLPIVALSASAELSVIEKALRVGADKCLTKPFNPDQLHSVLAELLQKNQVINHVETRSVPHGIQKTTKEKIDLNRIDKASLGSSSFKQKMLELLIIEITRSVEEAAEAITTHDMQAFAATLHKLKSNIFLLGMDKLGKTMSALEQDAHKGIWDDSFKTRFDLMKFACQNIVQDIRRILQKDISEG
jgi:PAS domain S-box-containing protein